MYPNAVTPTCKKLRDQCDRLIEGLQVNTENGAAALESMLPVFQLYEQFVSNECMIAGVSAKLSETIWEESENCEQAIQDLVQLQSESHSLIQSNRCGAALQSINKIGGVLKLCQISLDIQFTSMSIAVKQVISV